MDFVSFMIRKNADCYGYNVDYNAKPSTNLLYVKRIFEHEMNVDPRYYCDTALRGIFTKWIRDLDCIVSILDNLGYTDYMTLDYYTPRQLRKYDDDLKLAYIENVIYELLYK